MSFIIQKKAENYKGLKASEYVLFNMKTELLVIQTLM